MRRTPSLLLVALIPVLALLAACGTSGGAELTSSGEKSETSTTAGDNGENGDTGDAPTPAALAALLPTVDEVGAGYKVSDENLDGSSDDSEKSDAPDPTDQAILDACPGAKFLDELDNADDSAGEVHREFNTDQDATIEVSLDATPDGFDEKTVDQIVKALADCETITTHDDDGGDITMDLSATKSDAFGDFGLEMKMRATFTVMGTEIPIEFRGVVFSVDGTTVSVTASSGLDEATYEEIPGDYDAVPELAGLMEERVGSL
jgi:hypothetical protein